MQSGTEFEAVNLEDRRKIDVSALVTAYKRREQTIATLFKILTCEPSPKEVLVHVDGAQHEMAQLIAAKFPSVRLFIATENIGPGGGRNVLLQNASYEICASFDDDSYPDCADFFERIVATFDALPGAWVLAGQVRDRRGVEMMPAAGLARVATFPGGACAYRRSRIVTVGGYVPLPIAYGMEELDLSLRLYALGGQVVFVPELVVFHDTDLAHQKHPSINAAALCNVGLHCVLRYPPLLWPLGILQIANRVAWAIRVGQLGGLLRGLLFMPSYIWKRRHFRKVVPMRAVIAFIQLKRHPIPLARV